MKSFATFSYSAAIAEHNSGPDMSFGCQDFVGGGPDLAGLGGWTAMSWRPPSGA
jgi:hypothetical protein